MSSRTTLALVALALGAGLGVGAARADTVVLRDGRVLNGRVTEQGDKIYIEVRGMGGILVPRSDVVRIEGAAGQPEQRAAQDVVVLKDGRIVRGDVRFSDDGGEVIVGLGDRGEVRHPRSAVAVIQRRDGTATPGAAGPDAHEKVLNETIDRRVRELMHGTDVERLEARRELLALGAFSRAYLETVAERSPEAMRPILADLDRLEALRRVLPTRAEEAIPRLAERFVSPNEADRESALRAVVMEVPDQAGPLLLHTLKTDESPRVRAYCVSQLSALRRYEELAEVLRVSGDGRLRLAAAFALGDAGIYAGIPILIEALRLPDVEIRTVAIQKLTEYTNGQHFGYRAQGSPEDRERSIAQWNAWWNENGAQLVRDSIKLYSPDSELGVVTAEEKQRASSLWAEANRLIAASLQTPAEGDQPQAPATPQTSDERTRRLERAQDLIRQALDHDPSLSSARMTRAVLLYDELDRPRDAERQLNLIITRAEHDPGDADAARKYANYHLGRIALQEGLYERAIVRFSQALQYDPKFVDAMIALGDTQIAIAAAPVDEGGAKDVADRAAALGVARQRYQEAQAAIEKQEEELRGVMRDLVSEAPDSFAEGQVLQAVRRSLEELQHRRAAVHFAIGRTYAAVPDGQEQAVAAFREANRLDPENGAYRDALRAWGSGPSAQAPDTRQSSGPTTPAPAPTTSTAPPASAPR